jgi:hypothetical protein
MGETGLVLFRSQSKTPQNGKRFNKNFTGGRGLRLVRGCANFGA